MLRLAQLQSQVILTLQSLHQADLALTDYVAVGVSRLSHADVHLRGVSGGATRV